MLSIESSKPAFAFTQCRPAQTAIAGQEMPGDAAFRLSFSGSMGRANCREFEQRIVEALQAGRHVELDLAGVHEIDLHGVHLLGLLHRMKTRKVSIVAASPAVKNATRRLFAAPFSPHGEN